MDNQKLQMIQRMLIVLFCFFAIVVVGGIGLYIYLGSSSPEAMVQEEIQRETGLADATTFLPDNCNLYEEMPDIVFEDENGNEAKLSDFRGKTLVITFWASWCPDCHEQFEIIRKCKTIVDKQDNAEYILLNKLDHDKETKEQALQYLDDNNINIQTYFDDGLKVYDALGMHNVPTTFFIDPQGILRAWSGVQITDAAVFEAYLNNCVLGSEVVTEQFVLNNMTDEDGGIHSSYESGSEQETMKSAVLSESQGAVLEYALLMENQELFDRTWVYIRDHMSDHGMIAWQVVDGKQDGVNALIDDFRIYDSLVKANDVWGGYDEQIADYRKNIEQYGILEDHYFDFYDFANKEAAKRFTLCYADFEAMKHLAENNPDCQKAYENAYVLVTEGFISEEFPLYYSWYDYDKGEYAKTDLNMSEAMVTLLHLAEEGSLRQETVDWLKQELYRDGIKARYDVNGKVVVGYGYESTATYALVAMIGKEIGDEEITGKALKKMEKMRINNVSLEYNGAFGNNDGTGITSFDQIMPMLAYAYYGNNSHRE